MSHHYPTRYQSKIVQQNSILSYNEDSMSYDEVCQESSHNYQEYQELLFSSLIPHEMQKAVKTILLEHYDDNLFLTETEKKEAEQIYKMINNISSEHCKIKFMTYHYPIICRLHGNIELFIYMKYNYELVRHFKHLAIIYHNYYGHFSVLYSTLWNRCIDPSFHSYKDIYFPYCILLSTIKDTIHAGEMIYINEGLLKYY